jgi:hypothetical protein
MTTQIVLPDTGDPVPKMKKLPLQCMTMAPTFAPMVQAQGCKGLMSPSACLDFHPFAEMLQEWDKTGVSVDCGKTIGMGDNRSSGQEWCTHVS